MRKGSVAMLGMMGALAIAPGAAWAGAPVCCSSGDNGKPLVGTSQSAAQLGQTSPAVENQSLHPEYQAFVFTRNAARYIEVADASGTPRAAFTVLNGGLLTLPVGHDAVQEVAFPPLATDTVYQDATMVVGVRPLADGATVWQVFLK